MWEKIEKIINLISNYQDVIDKNKNDLFQSLEKLEISTQKLKDIICEILKIIELILPELKDLKFKREDEIEIEERMKNLIDLENILTEGILILRILNNLDKFIKKINSTNSFISGLTKFDGIVIYSILIPFLTQNDGLEAQKILNSPGYEKITLKAEANWVKSSAKNIKITEIKKFRNKIKETFYEGKQLLAEFDTLFWRKNNSQ